MNTKIKPILLAVAIAGFGQGALASDWQPIASERLIKLPAAVIAKALEQDFRESELAQELDGTDTSIGNIKSTLDTLTSSLAEAEGEARTGLQFEVLQTKSSYLDEMESYQQYRRQFVTTKLETYQKVLEEIQKQARLQNDPDVKALTQSQLASRQRLEANKALVTDDLFPAAMSETSRYSAEYDANMGKIKQLQAAIRQHDANRAAMVDGESVSRETFVRHLLAEAETDLALLDQEDEMLDYMARLVALDAQALQIQVAYGPETDDAARLDERKPRNMVDAFVQ